MAKKNKSRHILRPNPVFLPCLRHTQIENSSLSMTNQFSIASWCAMMCEHYAMGMSIIRSVL